METSADWVDFRAHGDPGTEPLDVLLLGVQSPRFYYKSCKSGGVGRLTTQNVEQFPRSRI